MVLETSEKRLVAMLMILVITFLIFNSVMFNLQASNNICNKVNLRSSFYDSTPAAAKCTDAGNQDNQNDDQQPYRTAFHFQPPKNWINDPNGPMIYKGIYHFFYQYNPHAAVWGNIEWAHATSTDLINWESHDPAIKPSHPYDISGCWSGSVTILSTGQPAMLYTGMDPQLRQVQNLATPKNLSDPYLVEWVKSPENPVMELSNTSKIDPSSFRDPTTAWLGKDGRWKVLIGSEQNGSGLAILYTSEDFVEWTKAENPLYSAPNTGMWECPDLFPVSNTSSTYGLDTSTMMIGRDIKHVFKISLAATAHDVYTIGTYNHDEDTYVPDIGSLAYDFGTRYDYGKFYASKTFFDSAKKRRILWAWVNESSSTIHDIAKGWSGVQAVPRSLWLDQSGKQLIQWPVVELEQLRTKQVTSQIKSITEGSVHEISGITANQADVEITFKMNDLSKAEALDPSWTTNPQSLCSKKDASIQGGVGPFGLLTLASKGLEEYTAVFFRIFKAHKDKFAVLMCSDQSRSSLENDIDKTTYGAFVDIDPLKEDLSLKTLIDHSIVESFGGMGKVCITARVYPKLAIGEATHLYVFNNGIQGVEVSRLNAWSMKKAIIT